jgi:S1-C subfamily serine protease
MNIRLVTSIPRVSPRKPFRAILISVLFSLFWPAQTLATDWDSIDELLAAVVGVQATVPAHARTARALGQERFGSGVVIDSSGLIVTIGYLILEADRVEIVLPNNELMPVEMLAYDYDTGFGLLRATAEVSVRPMELGSSSRLTPGDKMMIASYGGSRTLAPAIFTGAREFAGYWEYLLEDALFTVPTYPQYGGAALISPAGKLLGIGSLAVGDAVEGEQTMPGNMFVPIDRLKSVLGDLLTEGRTSGPRKPWLGIYTDEFQGRLLVSRVADGGPAMTAGIEPGDIITAAGGEPVYSIADFYRKIWAQGNAGDPIRMTIIKGSEVREVTVRSGDRYQWLELHHAR